MIKGLELEQSKVYGLILGGALFMMTRGTLFPWKIIFGEDMRHKGSCMWAKDTHIKLEAAYFREEHIRTNDIFIHLTMVVRFLAANFQAYLLCFLIFRQKGIPAHQESIQAELYLWAPSSLFINSHKDIIDVYLMFIQDHILSINLIWSQTEPSRRRFKSNNSQYWQKIKIVYNFGEMQATPKVQYIECQRGGYHTAQVLNMVCLEQQCAQNQLCCCACIEENHKTHQTRPLRLIMQEAQTASGQISPVKFNIDIALELLASHLKQTMDVFSKYKKLFISSIQQIQASLLNHHSLIIEQLKLKNVDPKAQIHQAFETIQLKVTTQTDYSQAVKKIASLIKGKKDEKTLTESDILSSLKTNHSTTIKRLHENVEEINKGLQRYLKELNESLKQAAIWKKEQYKFSSTLKHADVKIIEDNLVKSTNNSGYKFIIMTPHLEGGANIKKLAFKIKESSSNWVAVGMCHPKIVASKNYGFNFSSIGHGAYMVSANGGIWSHAKTQHNNSVKAFKFTKGDIIQVMPNIGDKTIVFKKNTETYQIPFETIPNDELSPCVLFYYLNDQVEFLPNYQE